MDICDAVTTCFSGKFEFVGKTYDSIVWKHIPEHEYMTLSDDKKTEFVLNETSNVAENTYALKQLVLSDGSVAFDTLKTQEEYENLDDEVKSNFQATYKMYVRKPIPLEEISSTYENYKNNIAPMLSLRQKRNTLLSESDKFVSIPDWPHPTEEVRQAWLDYRQALRDLPANTTDPENPIWPTPPE